MRKYIRYLGYILTLVLGACGNQQFPIDWSQWPEIHYRHPQLQQAQALFLNGNCHAAQEKFEKYANAHVVTSPRMYVDKIKAAYCAQDDDAVIQDSSFWLTQNPFAPERSYVLSLRGLSQFRRAYAYSVGPWHPFNPATGDENGLKKAHEDLSDAEVKLPKQSALYRLVAEKRRVLSDKLAEHQWQVLLFYYQRHAYVAALNRANYLIKYYPHSKWAQQSKEVKQHCQAMLGLRS